MIQVELPADVAQFVQEAIALGRYPNAQEVVTEAIRLLRDSGQRHQRLRGEIAEALAGIDRGEGIEIEDDAALAAFFDDLQAEVQTAMEVEKKEAR